MTASRPSDQSEGAASNPPRGFADGNRNKRRLKALKIEGLLGGSEAVAGKDILDLGAGAGLLSEFFVQRGARVEAADRDRESFRVEDVPFHQIDGTTLPFSDASFDIIIFNHVIEHVGERSAQKSIVAEIARCLRTDGTLYLAVPNSWALIEPHYGLPLLGALPVTLADTMVRAMGKGPRYDCRPFARRELLALLRPHFASVRDETEAAVRWVAAREMRGGHARVLANLPSVALRVLAPFMPTLIVTARCPKRGYSGDVGREKAS